MWQSCHGMPHVRKVQALGWRKPEVESLDVTDAGSAAKAWLPAHLVPACALLCCLRISLHRAGRHV